MLKSKFACSAALIALALVALVPSTASAWAPADSATVKPGNMTFTDGAQCTSNFVYQDSSTVYLGQAAHCSGTGAATETNGCDSESLPIGTRSRSMGRRGPGRWPTTPGSRCRPRARPTQTPASTTTWR